MAANQVDFKILPSDQFSVYSPQTRSDKVITYFTLLSKLRGDILSVGQDDDPNDIVSAFYSSVGGTQTLHLVKADGSEITASVPEPTVGTVTSVDLTASTGISVSGGPITTSGSITVTNTAPDQVVVLTGAGTTSISGTYPSFTITSNDQYVGTVTSVGLTMPAAFSVANSPVTNSGTLAVTAIGLSSQYIRGDGQLANFPTPGGGGSSVNYYLNGSVNQGTFGGVTYYELSKTPIAGAGTNFTRTNASGDGYVASFITDANDPDQINIPGGNFNLEFYFNSSSSGGSPAFYGELYKVSTSNVFTLIASGSANPEVISGGTFVDQYYTSIAVPQTALLATDRLAIRVYVIVDGRNITLHTEDANFSEVITTFSTGLNSLNGLSDQVQYFAVGTSGTDFAISSSVDTHTFNLPTASAANRGALSSADWTTFNGKASDAFKTIAVAGQSDIVADNATDTLTIVAGTNVTITTNATTDTITINSADQFVGTVTSVATTAPITGGTIITTGTIGITQSGAAADGYLSSTDWNTFNSKEPALTKGNLTEATSSVLTITGGTGAVIGSGTTIQVSQATTTTSGFLSSTDWNTFNNKQGTITLTTTGTTGAATFISNTLNIPNYADQFVGTVTSVNLTAGDRIEVSGGPITTSGSITVTHGTSSGADVTTAQSFRLRVIADGGTFEAFNDVAIAIGSLEDIATPQDTDNSGGTVLQNIVLDEFGHLLGVGSITLDTDDIIEGPTNLYFTNARARSALSAGTGITYDTSTGIITNSAPDQVVSLTGAGTTTISGTYPSFTVTSNDQFVGTVTSVAALTIGTTGTDLSSTVANSTTTPVITLNVPTASAANRGALSSADWTTFNSKEPALTKGNLTEATSAVLTITGGTGAVIGTGTSIQVAQSGVSTSGFLSSTDWNTFNGKQNALTFSVPLVNTSGTVSIPAATSLVDGYLSATDFATFNGKQNALTLTTTGTTGAATLIGATLNIPNYADQFVGTVTSVDMSVPTGFAISGNPITTSGTLAVAFASGYSLPTNASQTTWDTAYNDSITAFAYNTSTGALTLTQQDAGTLTATVTLQPFSTTNLVEGTNLYYTDTRARLALSAGTGITYDSATGIITNSAPDQVVVLTAGTGISTSGTYPSFTVTNSAPDQTVVLTASTGITTSGTYPNFTIANSAPDQTVVLTGGTGITTSGTYPSFTITNSAPDQTVVLTAGTGISVSGTYPSFTVTNSSPSSGGTVTSVAALTIGTTGTDLSSTVADGTTTPVITLQVPTASAANRGALSSTDWTTFNGKQSAITLTTTGSTGAATFISNTLNIPNYTDQFVGTVTSVATTAPITGGTFTTTGTIGITQSGVSTDGYLSSTDWGTFNSKQPQLNGTGFVKASGTTISYDNNTYYLASNPSGFTSNTGTVTSVNLTAGARIEVAGGPITTSGSITVTHGVADGADFVTAEEFRDRVIADGGIFEALGEVAIAIGSLSDAASPSSTDYSDGYVLQNIAIDEFGHVLGVGVTDLDDRYAQNLTAGTGITVSGSPSSTAGLITVTNSDKGSSQNIFKNIAVTGQSTIIADNNDDTLTLASGYGILITTDATTDIVTIASDFSAAPVYSVSRKDNYSISAYSVTASWAAIDIDGDNIDLAAPVDSDGVNSAQFAIVTIELENMDAKGFVVIGIRLYNLTQTAAITDAESEIKWTGYLDLNGSDPSFTTFTYHIPIENYVLAGDVIEVQAINYGANAVNINAVTFSLIAKNGPI